MGQIYSFFTNITDYFSKSPRESIDFEKGKQDEHEYFQGRLPKIKLNLDINGKFIDPYFSHDINAITANHNPLINEDMEDDEDREKEINEYEEYSNEGIIFWERISNLLKDINIKRDLKKGIAQRGLGDCYLISFLRGFLKFQPEKFYKLFGQCHPEIGYWEINFIVKDKNIKVFVDDYIVFTKDFQPLFAGVRVDNKFAVGIALIIEKAYAKLNGSYMNIEGNNQCFDSYYHFTGLPSSTVLVKDLTEDDVYDEVEEYLIEKNVVTCGTPDVEKEKKFPIKGVSKNHAYLITKNEIKKGEKIMELNNPWGFNDYEMMEFDTKINDLEVKMYIKSFNINQNNLNSGELKIDLKSLMDYWSDITYIKFKKDMKEPKNAKKKKLPIGVPPDGLDDGDIDEIFGKRIGILDYIGIDRNTQKNYLKQFKDNPELGISLLFFVFMIYGTTKTNFYGLLDVLKRISQNKSQKTENFNQSSDIFSEFMNLAVSQFKIFK